MRSWAQHYQVLDGVCHARGLTCICHGQAGCIQSSCSEAAICCQHLHTASMHHMASSAGTMNLSSLPDVPFTACGQRST